MTKLNYNPDVLSCLANLSNDEVFTPPQLANQMLDMLPQELFQNPDTKFLDPCSKSGVFLREIAKRLIDGLATKIPDLQERIDHIMQHQLYGMAITQLTSLMSRRSLYCSKDASGKYSLSHFDNADGNIRYKDIQHSWQNGKCRYCGASQEVYDRGDGLESHAYEFIHTDNPNELYNNMTFDVIIGNPPYQLSDGGNGRSSIPIYHLFVEKAKLLNPHYLIMILPSRWFTGGRGLDEFRARMLNDDRIKYIRDFLDAKDLFPSADIAGGINYILWSKSYHGLCNYGCTYNGENCFEERKLNEYSTFIRRNAALDIIKKIVKEEEDTIESYISTQTPFGFVTTYRGKASYFNNALSLYSSGGISYVKREDVTRNSQWIDSYKVIFSKATCEHAGKPDKSGRYRVFSTMKILKPQEICTQSYLVGGTFYCQEKAENYLSYLKTCFVRFLMLQLLSTQDISAEKFRFVPLQDFSKPWTDAELYAKYGLTDEEIQFIESMIKPMD